MAENVEVRIELLGFDSFIKTVTTDINAAIDKDTQNLHSDLVTLMEDIKENHVPIDKGDLAASGYVSDPIVTPAGTTIAMGFTEEYALIQHERLDYNHKHGHAKYLEVPLEQYYSNTV